MNKSSKVDKMEENMILRDGLFMKHLHPFNTSEDLGKFGGKKMIWKIPSRFSETIKAGSSDPLKRNTIDRWKENEDMV